MFPRRQREFSPRKVVCMAKKTTTSRIDDLGIATGRLCELFATYLSISEAAPQEVIAEVNQLSDMAYSAISQETRKLIEEYAQQKQSESSEEVSGESSESSDDSVSSEQQEFTL